MKICIQLIILCKWTVNEEYRARNVFYLTNFENEIEIEI